MSSKNEHLYFLHGGPGFKDYLEPFFSGLNSDLTPAEIFLSEAEVSLGEELLKRCDETFDRETFQILLNTYLADFNLIEKLKVCPIRIALVSSTHDRRFPQSVGRDLQKNLPHAHYLELEGSGHFPFLVPQKKDEIISFIKSLIEPR